MRLEAGVNIFECAQDLAPANAGTALGMSWPPKFSIVSWRALPNTPSATNISVERRDVQHCRLKLPTADVDMPEDNCRKNSAKPLPPGFPQQPDSSLLATKPLAIQPSVCRASMKICRPLSPLYLRMGVCHQRVAGCGVKAKRTFWCP